MGNTFSFHAKWEILVEFTILREKFRIIMITIKKNKPKKREKKFTFLGMWRERKTGS